MQFTSLGLYEDFVNTYPFAVSVIIALAVMSYLAEINAMTNISTEQRRLYPEAFAV
ncbi:MAG: hypothetical protein ACI9V1_001889 [Spirosomataceae bacterium]|jgi:hypothetical protein